MGSGEREKHNSVLMMCNTPSFHVTIKNYVPIDFPSNYQSSSHQPNIIAHKHIVKKKKKKLRKCSNQHIHLSSGNNYIWLAL